MIYCAGLELHALLSPTGTRYALGITYKLVELTVGAYIHTYTHIIVNLIFPVVKVQHCFVTGGPLAYLMIQWHRSTAKRSTSWRNKVLQLCVHGACTGFASYAIAADNRACTLYVAMVSGTVGKILCKLGQGQAVRLHRLVCWYN